MTDGHSEIKAQLETKLKELEERAERIEMRLRDPGVADSEENAILHENDEVLTGLNDLAIKEIHEIKLAIHRIEHGTYGVCSSCGKRIAKARLTALPFAANCVECAS